MDKEETATDCSSNIPDKSTMSADELKKFIDTGRTGRRNALPDVTQPQHASTSTAGVAEELNKLTFKDNEEGSSDLALKNSQCS